jgi:hypothetical protein
MRGLVATATDRADEALAAFAAEAEQSSSGLFAREFQWLAATSAGFHHAWRGRHQEALNAFEKAESLNPGAARGVLGLHLITKDVGRVERAVAEMASGPKTSDATLTHAALLAWTSRPAEACTACHALLKDAPTGPTAWSLAADPIFLPLHGDERLRPPLAAIASRAA